jgi:hypothetical protein
MANKLSPNAPRFHTLWENREGRRIFIMKKDEWNSVKTNKGNLFKLDLEQVASFPMGGVASQPGFLSAVASSTGEEVKMTIYREDPKDFPTPINVDIYTIWESFPSQVLTNRSEMIQTADTNADVNFEVYEEDHIFIVKEDAGEGHWLGELPSSVVALIDDI